jgi:hypothetical protein
MKLLTLGSRTFSRTFCMSTSRCWSKPLKLRVKASPSFMNE